MDKQEPKTNYFQKHVITTLQYIFRNVYSKRGISA